MNLNKTICEKCFSKGAIINPLGREYDDDGNSLRYSLEFGYRWRKAQSMDWYCPAGQVKSVKLNVPKRCPFLLEQITH